MKILRISLRNIASLEGMHTVDFTRDPLRSTGLFAISGITGSGKSTLLDALCLALYERTPRLSAARGTVKLADGTDSISQRDPANLLRRGTGEGLAEVAFVGVDGQTYTARWNVRRARNRADGNLQNTEMTLFRGNPPPGENGVIEQGGRKSEVLPVIAARIGLTFEQFTRAVLLAQNDFATFLKAEDKERAEILQALTGTERFGAISMAVFERATREQRRSGDLEARLAGNTPLPPEARAEAETGLSNAQAAWQDSNDRIAALEVQASWFKQLAELTQQAEDAAASLRGSIALRDAASPRRSELQHTEEASRTARPLWDSENRLRTETTTAERSRDTAAKADTTARAGLTATKLRFASAQTAFETAKVALESAKPQLLQARELDAKLIPLADRLSAATRDREAAEQQLKQATTTRDQLQTRRTSAEADRTPLQTQRTALAPLATLAPEATAWLQRLDHGAISRESLERALAKFALATKAEQDRLAAASAERAREPSLREAARAATAESQQAEARAREHDGEKIAQHRSAADGTRTVLRELEKQFQVVDHLTSQVSTLEGELTDLRSAIEAGAKSLVQLQEKQIPDAEMASNAARRAFDLAEAAITDEAIRLREKLVDDQPCPVCGATAHPHATHPPTGEAQALRALRADWTKQEAGLRSLRENVAGLAATRTTQLAQEVEKRKALTALQTRLTSARSIHSNHPVAAAILALPLSDRAAALAAQLATQQEVLDAAEAAEVARRVAEKARDACRTRRDKAAANVEALEKSLAKFAEELAALRASREAAAIARTEAEKSLQSSLETLAPLFLALPEARGLWDRDATSYRNRFARDTAAFMDLEGKIGQLNATIRETDAALVPAQEALIRAQSDEGAKRISETSARGDCETVRNQRAGLLSGKRADDVEAGLNEAHHRALEARDLLSSALEKAGHQVASTVEFLRAADATLANALQRQIQASAALDAWLADFAPRTGRVFDRSHLAAMLARDETWIKTERAALDTIEGAVRAAEGALTAHQKNLEAHRQRRPTPDDESTVAAALAAVRTAFGEISHRRDLARALLMADDQRIGDNTLLTGQLREQQAIAAPWLKLNELIGSADGAKFRGIAQRHTLDILLGYANVQLEQLANRYRLERLPESLNLIVVDRDMGDERRSVHSLSGGESFLISLALALALASLTSNRLRIESLFIDEGFGNLDSETLHTAMNALMRLEAQGRKVGVISHVTEMTDAIPVQIRVIKGRGGASRLIVPGVPEN